MSNDVNWRAFGITAAVGIFVLLVVAWLTGTFSAPPGVPPETIFGALAIAF